MRVRENLIGDKWDLGATLDRQQTARVLDVLRSIEGLELRYSRNYVIPPEKEQVLREYLGRALSDILGIHPGMIAGHDIFVHLGIGEYGDKKRYSRVRLNFHDMSGLEIVQFGFSSMEGYDTESHYKLIRLRNESDYGSFSSGACLLSDKYSLAIHNPTGDPVLSIPRKERALRRARYIAEQLIPALPIQVKVS